MLMLLVPGVGMGAGGNAGVVVVTPQLPSMGAGQ